jgi:hypothetical protein
MEEKILPDDFNDYVNQKGQSRSRSDFAQAPRSDFAQAPRSDFAQAPRSDFAQAPRSDFAQAPRSDFSQAPRSDFAQAPRRDFDTVAAKIDDKKEIKKKNVFIRLSNHVSNKPKIYLVLIIALIAVILILIIYYRGLLYIGPFCPNNVKSSSFKNKMLANKNGDTKSNNSDINLKDSLSI